MSYYRIKIATLDNISSITVIKSFTEDMRRLVIELHKYIKDENGRLIPKEGVPEQVLSEFNRTGRLNKKYALYEYDYYKIKEVNGNAVLKTTKDTRIQKCFEHDIAVPINYIELEIIKTDEYSMYGKNKLKYYKTTNAGGVYDNVGHSDESNSDSIINLLKLLNT